MNFSRLRPYQPFSLYLRTLRLNIGKLAIIRRGAGLFLSATLLLASSLGHAAVGGVNHIGLSVSKLQQSQDFFINSLDFRLVGTRDSYPAAFVSNGEIMVTLWQVSNIERHQAFDRKNNVGLHHLAFNVDSFTELEQLHQKLLKTPGVVIEFAPELLGPGPSKHMMIREPSGNRLEFIHRP